MVTKNEGFLLQGVSQQDRAVRQPGQVTEQINRIPDVVLGNVSRPGTKHMADIDEITGHQGSIWTQARVGGETFLLEYNRAKGFPLALYNMSGVKQPLTWRDRAGQYFGTNMTTLVYKEVVFFVNRDVVVERSALDATDNTRNEAVVWAISGNMFREYTLTLKDSTGTYRVKYESQDGETDAQIGRIIGSLYDEITAISDLSSYTFTRSENYIRIYHPTRTFTVSTTDGDEDKFLRTAQRNVKTLADLPPIAPNGMRITVTGEKSSDDDVYMRFLVYDDVGTTGFGTPGRWVETATIAESNTLNVQTMPYYLSWDASISSYVIQAYPWTRRDAGDDSTNKFPSFVGQKIRDIAEFQSRLVIAAGASIVMSETDRPENFFRKSVSQKVSSDRIDIRSSRNSAPIEWMVPFDRDLILLTEDTQLMVYGTTGITPDNASIVVTTSFEMSARARPPSTGRTLLLPYVSREMNSTRGFAGLNEFFTSGDSATNSNDPITRVIPRYIPGEIKYMDVSPNYGVALIQSTDTAHSRTLWLYSYLWEGTNKSQSSWGKLTFPFPVRHFFFRSGVLYLLLEYSLNKLALWSMPLVPTFDDDVEFHVTLDAKRRVTLNSTDSVLLPHQGMQFVGVRGVETNGNRVTPASVVAEAGGWRYTFTDVDSSAVLYAGLPITRTLLPTMPVPRNYKGELVHNSDVLVTVFNLKYSRSGELVAKMQTAWRDGPEEVARTWFPVADDLTDPRRNSTRSGVFNIPWGEVAGLAELVIESTDFRPDAFYDLSWEGKIVRDIYG